MKKLILTALSFALCAGAAEYQLHLAPESTQVTWTLGDVLHTVHGTFKLRRGDIVFDNETGKAGGEVVVDAASGESGSSARDGRMHKNVLESAKYPDVSFTPDHLEGKVELTGVSNVKLHGTFRIHGGDHEITVPVMVSASGDTLDARIKFDVPFVAWGMKDPSTLILRVNKSVGIEIRATGRLSGAGTAFGAKIEIPASSSRKNSGPENAHFPSNPDFSGQSTTEYTWRFSGLYRPGRPGREPAKASPDSLAECSKNECQPAKQTTGVSRNHSVERAVLHVDHIRRARGPGCDPHVSGRQPAGLAQHSPVSSRRFRKLCE
jgi:polyisoprenoid-binding protein YceI